MRGFDHLRGNDELLLCLPFREATGTTTQDWAKPHHEPVSFVNTPAWTGLGNDMRVLDFDSAGPDHLLCLAADSGDLDFVAGSFSMAAWILPHALGNRNIMTKGADSATGWYWELTGGGAMRVCTSQAAATQNTWSQADIVINTWQFIAATRIGAVVTTYRNGMENTATPGTHINPVTAAALNFYVAVNNLAAAAWYDGFIWNPRVWDKVVSADDIRFIFELERDWLGV